MTSPNELTATEALDAMRAGRLSVEELARACLARARERDDAVRGWVQLDPTWCCARPAPSTPAPPRARCTACPSPLGHVTGDPSFNLMWTLLHGPVVTVPGFAGPSGLPVGPSLTSPRCTDRRLLRVAAAVGALFGARGAA